MLSHKMKTSSISSTSDEDATTGVLSFLVNVESSLP